MANRSLIFAAGVAARLCRPRAWQGLAVSLAVGTAPWGCARVDQNEPTARRATPPIAQPELVSPLGIPLYIGPPGEDQAELQSALLRAVVDLSEAPEDPQRIVWIGRRLGYLWSMNDAVEVFTAGIRAHPDHAPLYRHRGHRYLSLRRFDEAIDDFRTAARLIEGRPDEVEPDGRPNERGIPLTTTAFNIWYHMGLAHYLKGDFEPALEAFRKAGRFSRGYDDNLVAVTDWTYMCLRRLKRDAEANEILAPIHADMDIIENHAYHRRLLMYKGLIAPAELLDVDGASELDWATLGYGLGFWRLVNGEREEAKNVWNRVVRGPYWPAFGYIAAETELSRGVRGRESPEAPCF